MKENIRAYLTDLLAIPSPTGYTDKAADYVKNTLTRLNIPFESTNRGAVIARLGSEHDPAPKRVILVHLDTLGAMLSQIEADGTLRMTMLGCWSARFAEGARVSLVTDSNEYRGTILPEKASGHVYADAVDEQPINWENLVLRLDERIHSKDDVTSLGIQLGDIITVDSVPEFASNGFINCRHLDDKAAAAVVLSILENYAALNITVPCDIIFTVTEEIGTGAQHTIKNTVKECLAIDISTDDKTQNTCEGGVTFVYKDSSGPYDRQLTQQLENLCQDNTIAYSRDVFRHYRSDASAAIEGGHDIRCALACFEINGSHGYERTHMDSLIALENLLSAYLQSDLDD